MLIGFILGISSVPSRGAEESTPHGPGKISPIILAHQQEKYASADMPAAQRFERLKVLGLNAEDLTGEQCALYVERRLTPQEADALAARGIFLNSDGWVRPVPGRHAHGFHLARVEYASLDLVADDPRFIQAESLESTSYPLNLNARTMIKAEDVLNGNGIVSRDGTGINIAVADTGIDLTHADFPTPTEAYDMTDGTDTSTWGTNVANTVMDHGTHVAGSVLGRGTLSAAARYRGAGPGANLYFYKIGDDVSAGASDADMIEAINRASAVGCLIFSMSYGGISPFMDGSSPVCQAIDSASASGMACFIAAGNDGDTNRHYSIAVAPGTPTPTFAFVVNNTTGAAYTGPEDLRVLWRDGVSDNNMVLTCTNLGAGESLTAPWSATSGRGTEARQYLLNVNLAISASKTYNLRLQNTAVGGATPLVHVWRAGGLGSFTAPDASYTVNHPATADTAIAVGAWIQAPEWRDWQNTLWQFQTWYYGYLAPFSSQGPRIDGVRKPSICAPGAVTASCRDTGTFTGYPLNKYRIDNDGTNDGLGPADYYIHWGTSMACPMAAGAAALLLEAAPGMTPSQLVAALESTAGYAAAPNNNAGAGLIDIKAAIQTIDCNNNGQYDPLDVAIQDCNSNASPDDCDTFTNAASFAVSGDFFSGTGPKTDLAVADLDGDNDLDLAEGRQNSGSLRIWLNDGNGVFTAVQQFGIADAAEYVAAGDLDGDGDIDLAASERTNDRVVVLLNNGAATFSAAGSVATADEPRNVELVDLDRDGDLDIAVLVNAFTPRITIALNNGNGMFPTTSDYFGLSSWARGFACGDLDNDGYADLAAGNGNGISIYMNNKNATFAAPAHYPPTFPAYSLVMADFDMDGRLDVAAATAYLNIFWWFTYADVLRNNGNGTLAAPVQYSGPVLSQTNLSRLPIAAGDVNGDGVPDLVLGGGEFGGPNNLYTLLNNRDGTFQSGVPNLTGNWSFLAPNSLAIGDWDLDGRPDLTSGNGGNGGGSITVLMNQTTPPAGRDCNANNSPDDCEIAAGSVQDCQPDGIPDDCQLAGNDCNGNGAPDECDISGGGSQDVNGNALPDECEILPCATCEGDLSGDGVVNGPDIQAFVDCYLGGSLAATGCSCADVSNNAALDSADVSSFLTLLTSGASCP